MIVVGAACASITMAASDKCGASFQQKSNIAQCGNNFYFTNKLEFDAEFVFFYVLTVLMKTFEIQTNLSN